MPRLHFRSRSNASPVRSEVTEADVEKGEKSSLLPRHALERPTLERPKSLDIPRAKPLEPDDGLRDDHGLKLLSTGEVDGEPPIGTLIFIHGLGGHFVRTWSHERDSNFFWPKIWLPTADGLRAVRIMSFGYDAGIFRFTPSVACVSDFARSLLMNIMVHPSLEDGKVRALV